MTTPSSWTSAYNDAFRDRRKFISPRADQPMYHYRGTYDKSHFQEPTSVAHATPSQTQSAASFDKTAASAFGNANSNTVPASALSSSAFSSTATASPTGFGYSFPKAVPGGKELWNHVPNATHGGIQPHGGVYGESNLPYAPAPHGAGVGAGAAAAAAAGANRGSEGADARPKYHVPGYSGFVRGEQFRFGDTYGKTTRMALDVPTSLPLEP